MFFEKNNTKFNAIGILILIFFCQFSSRVYSDLEKNSEVQETVRDFKESDYYQNFICLKILRFLVVYDNLLKKYGEKNISEDVKTAHFWLRIHNYDKSVEFINKSLDDPNLQNEIKQLFLLELINIYEIFRQRLEVVRCYEKLVELFPDDKIAPEIFLKLGEFYMENNVMNLALNRFYGVLNCGLNASQNDMKFYGDLGKIAQLKITKVYFLMRDYEQTQNFISRIKMDTLLPEEKIDILFYKAYCSFAFGKNTVAMEEFKSFLQSYPEHSKSPESYVTLAKIYSDLKRPNDTIETIFKLLNSKHELEKENWLFWQQKGAQQVAKEFYEKNDFANAIKIYQKMLLIENTVEWQWPIIYKMGLCFERLGMISLAKQTYELLISVNHKNNWRIPKNLPNFLKLIQKNAKWHLFYLNWFSEFKSDFKKLTDLSQNSL